MKLVQHIPNFVDGVDPKDAEFSDLASFNEIEFVKDWIANVQQHDHFEINQMHRDSDIHVLSVNKDNTWWWVLGRVEDPTDEIRKMFPEWHAPGDLD